MICNLEVVGSNPTRGSMKKCRYRHFFFFCPNVSKATKIQTTTLLFHSIRSSIQHTPQKLLLTLKLYLRSYLYLATRQVLREFGIRHNRYASCCVALVGKIAISLPIQSCSESMISCPLLDNQPSVVHIFIIP